MPSLSVVGIKRMIRRICEICGKEFKVKPSIVKKGYGRFCSQKCHGIWHASKQKGSANPSWTGGKIKRTCKNCGKIFWVKPNIIRKGQGLYCSPFCSYEARRGEKSPYYKTKIKRICLQCKKEFEVNPSVVKDGYGKCCSRSCAAIGRRYKPQLTKTIPEVIFEEICKKNNLPFKYTGDRSFWIGRANPDFIHKTLKFVIEVNGDYWHSPLLNSKIRYTATVEGRQKQFKKHGYKLIVLWESDLKREDAEQFVLLTLKKFL